VCFAARAPFWTRTSALSGLNSRPFAPGRKGARKKPEKIGKSAPENGAKWRVLEDPKRHFAVPSSGGSRLEMASL
jgi:hypothetical protein